MTTNHQLPITPSSHHPEPSAGYSCAIVVRTDVPSTPSTHVPPRSDRDEKNAGATHCTRNTCKKKKTQALKDSVSVTAQTRPLSVRSQSPLTIESTDPSIPDHHHEPGWTLPRMTLPLCLQLEKTERKYDNCCETSMNMPVPCTQMSCTTHP